MCCPRVSPHINSSKTEYMAYNLRRQRDLTTLDYAKLSQVDDFQYLGSWKDQTTKDLEIRKAKAWAASNKLTVVWKSSLSRDLRIRFFTASVESVLLYWSENLTLTTALEKHLDGCHTKILRAALNVTVTIIYLTRSSTGTCFQFQQDLVSKYVGCSLVATVGEARMRLFPTSFGNQTLQMLKEKPRNNIH